MVQGRIKKRKGISNIPQNLSIIPKSSITPKVEGKVHGENFALGEFHMYIPELQKSAIQRVTIIKTNPQGKSRGDSTTTKTINSDKK